MTAEELGLLGSRAYVADARRVASDRAESQHRHVHAAVPDEAGGGVRPGRSDLADDARWVAAELGIDVQSDPQPQRNRFIRSDQYSFIRAGIPALATKIGVIRPIPRRREIDSKWFAERYHAVSDSADQPVDLAAVGHTRNS